MKQRSQPEKSRSGRFGCTSREGKATSFMGRVQQNNPAACSGKARSSRNTGDLRTALFLPTAMENFAAQVPAKSADTEL
jgi:hypothetical protein